MLPEVTEYFPLLNISPPKKKFCGGSFCVLLIFCVVWVCSARPLRVAFVICFRRPSYDKPWASKKASTEESKRLKQLAAHRERITHSKEKPHPLTSAEQRKRLETLAFFRAACFLFSFVSVYLHRRGSRHELLLNIFPYLIFSPKKNFRR